jgi:DnaJ family protein B protein 12
LFTTPPPPDPSYSWDSSSRFDLARNTWHRGVPYHVNKAEWEGSHLWESVPEARKGQKDAAMYSNKVRSFERGVETNYIQKLRNEVGRTISSSPFSLQTTSLVSSRLSDHLVHSERHLADHMD